MDETKYYLREGRGGHVWRRIGMNNQPRRSNREADGWEANMADADHRARRD